MKNVTVIVGLIAVGLATGCLEKPNKNPGTSSTILYRHHFAGSAQLAHNTNLARLPVILGLPVTHEFTEQTLQKLSRSPEELWRKFLPAGATTQPALVRPLLDDLASSESYAEVHGPLNRSESIFAIELSDDRARLWQAQVEQLAKGSDLDVLRMGLDDRLNAIAISEFIAERRRNMDQPRGALSV